MGRNEERGSSFRDSQRLLELHERVATRGDDDDDWYMGRIVAVNHGALCYDVEMIEIGLQRNFPVQNLCRHDSVLEVGATIEALFQGEVVPRPYCHGRQR